MTHGIVVVVVVVVAHYVRARRLRSRIAFIATIWTVDRVEFSEVEPRGRDCREDRKKSAPYHRGYHRLEVYAISGTNERTNVVNRSKMNHKVRKRRDPLCDRAPDERGPRRVLLRAHETSFGRKAGEFCQVNEPRGWAREERAAVSLRRAHATYTCTVCGRALANSREWCVCWVHTMCTRVRLGDDERMSRKKSLSCVQRLAEAATSKRK